MPRPTYNSRVLSIWSLLPAVHELSSQTGLQLAREATAHRMALGQCSKAWPCIQSKPGSFSDASQAVTGARSTGHLHMLRWSQTRDCGDCPAGCAGPTSREPSPIHQVRQGPGALPGDFWAGLPDFGDPSSAAGTLTAQVGAFTRRVCLEGNLEAKSFSNPCVVAVVLGNPDICGGVPDQICATHSVSIDFRPPGACQVW